MIVSQSKKKLISQAYQLSQRQMKNIAKSIQLKAAQDEFKMEQRFKNLQNPLQFIRNNKTQSMINDTAGVSQKLQSEMSETSEFSKNLYKKVLSNEDYIGFFKQISDNNEEREQPMSMEEILKIQRKMKEQKIASQNQQQQNPKELLKKSIAEKSNARQLPKVKGLKQYRHALQRDKQNIQENFNREIKFHHIKDLNTPKFDNDCKHIEFYNMLKSNKREEYMGGGQQFNIRNNEETEKEFDLKLKFRLIRESSEFGEGSKQLFFFDIDRKLGFWQDNQKEELVYINQSTSLVAPDQKLKDEQILSHFIDFNKSKIHLNNVLDFGMKTITPKLLASYFKLKSFHEDLMEREKRDDGLDGKYNELMKKYEDFKEKASKDKTRKLPSRIVDTETQTIKNYEDSNSHKFFEKFQLVEDILYKINKLNKLRERAMKSYKKKSNLVILKNICFEIDELLFKIIMLMLKGETFFLKENSELKKAVPIFTCSDIMTLQNKHEVERKILELIYGNIDKFQVEKVDNVTKKDMITIYVEEREKNNKVWDILETQI